MKKLCTLTLALVTSRECLGSREDPFTFPMRINSALTMGGRFLLLCDLLTFMEHCLRVNNRDQAMGGQSNNSVTLHSEENHVYRLKQFILPIKKTSSVRSL